MALDGEKEKEMRTPSGGHLDGWQSADHDFLKRVTVIGSCV